MKLKSALWLSTGILVAGTGYWFLFVRTKYTVTKKDREEMKAIEFEITD